MARNQQYFEGQPLKPNKNSFSNSLSRRGQQGIAATTTGSQYESSMHNYDTNEYALPLLPRSRNNTIQKAGHDIGKNFMTTPIKAGVF